MSKKLTEEEKAAKAAAKLAKKDSPKQEDKTVIEEKKEEKVMEEEKKEVIEYKKEEVIEEKVEEKKEEVKFETFCGSPFDPAQGSDCFMECRVSLAEQYNRCLEHFKKTVTESGSVKKARKASGTGSKKKGSNHWNHLIGSQAELIDRALEEAEGPITLEKIAEFAGAKVPRTRHHIKHLQNDFKVEIRITKERGLFIADRFLDLIYIDGTVDFD